MVNLKSVFLTTIGLCVLISCGTEPTPTYQLTTSVVGNGSVNPSNGQFDEGESVTITSTPDSGWVFSNWEGDWTSSQTPATITMDRDKTIIGVFERKEYPLNITIGEGEGSVSERVVSQPKVTDYLYETVVELTPVPANEWWSFSSWGGDITSDQQVVEVTVNGETNVTLNFGFTGNSYVVMTYEYDSNNNMTEVKQFYSDGTIGMWIAYIYDVNNNRIEQLNYESDGTVFQNRTYEYDSNYNLITETRYRDGIINYVVSHHYDSFNNLIEEIRRNGDGSLNGRFEYDYDSNNNVIERRGYSNTNSFSSRVTWEYDSSGNILEIISYDSQGSEGARIDFQYNSDGYIIRRDYKTYSGLFRNDTFLYEYDSKNNLIEFISLDDNNVRYKEVYKYDSQNRKIKESRFDESNTPEYFIIFEYDSNNNLIEEVRYEYQKGKIVSNQTDIDPLNELCNQLNLPEQQMIPIMCVE